MKTDTKTSAKSTNGNGAAHAETVQRIPLADLLISEQNTRHPKPADVSELALSMSEVGQTTPAIVRPHPKQKNKFEIAAGARRFVAAQVNKSDALACVVRPLDQNAFEELILIENLQRVDPDPRAEVELIDRLVKRGIATPDQISAHLGKPKHWSVRRIQLLKVIPELRQHWQAGELQHFSVEMMSLLGSFPADTQRALVEKNQWSRREEIACDRCESLAELKKFFDEHVTCRLDKSSFDLKDPRFFVKGCGPGCACDSSALQSLFSDDEPNEPPRCLRPQCFAQRLKLANAAKLADIKKEHGDLPIVTNGESRSGNDEIFMFGKQIHTDSVWPDDGTFHDKETKGAQKVLVWNVARSSLRVAWLKPKERSSHSGGSGSAKSLKSQTERRAERKKILQGKRWLAVHKELELTLRDTPHSGINENVVDLVAFFGLPDRAHPCSGDLREWRAFDARKAQGWPVEKVAVTYQPRSCMPNEKTRDAALWFGVREVLLDIMRPVGNVGDAERYAPMYRRVAKLIDFPIDEKKREADKQILPPRSWGAVDIHTLESARVLSKPNQQLINARAKKIRGAKSPSESKGYVLTCTREGRRHYVTGERADEGKWTKFIDKARVFGSAEAARKAIGKSKALILPLSRASKKASPKASKQSKIKATK